MQKYQISINQIIEFDKWLEEIINHQITWDYSTMKSDDHLLLEILQDYLLEDTFLAGHHMECKKCGYELRDLDTEKLIKNHSICPKCKSQVWGEVHINSEKNFKDTAINWEIYEVKQGISDFSDYPQLKPHYNIQQMLLEKIELLESFNNYLISDLSEFSLEYQKNNQYIKYIQSEFIQKNDLEIDLVINRKSYIESLELELMDLIPNYSKFPNDIKQNLFLGFFHLTYPEDEKLRLPKRLQYDLLYKSFEKILRDYLVYPYMKLIIKKGLLEEFNEVMKGTYEIKIRDIENLTLGLMLHILTEMNQKIKNSNDSKFIRLFLSFKNGVKMKKILPILIRNHEFIKNTRNIAAHMKNEPLPDTILDPFKDVADKFNILYKFIDNF